jgi:hypothetical protein
MSRSAAFFVWPLPAPDSGSLFVWGEKRAWCCGFLIFRRLASSFAAPTRPGYWTRVGHESCVALPVANDCSTTVRCRMSVRPVSVLALRLALASRVGARDRGVAGELAEDYRPGFLDDLLAQWLAGPDGALIFSFPTVRHFLCRLEIRSHDQLNAEGTEQQVKANFREALTSRPAE